MPGIGELFNKLLSGSKESPESKGTSDSSMLFGSYLGAELSLLLLLPALALLIVLLLGSTSFALAMVLLGISIILLIVSLPTVFRIRKESSDDFSMLGFYVVMGLIVICGLVIIWKVI